MIAHLHIQTALRNEITFLKNSFFTQPFKVANITEDKKGSLLQLMLMSASPGILDGDTYDIKVEVAANSSLQLQTQSYQRLYNMKEGASQKMEIFVAEGGSFLYLPHPTVPHEGASFVATNVIHLQSNTKLLWGEVITCGRKGSGESFLFSKFHTLTEIFLNEKLIIRENVLMQPSITNVHSIGQLEGFSHQATMIYLNDKISVKESIAEISRYLETIENIEYGITAAPVNGIIIRLLGYKAEQLFDILQSVANPFLIIKNIQHVG